MYGLGLGPEAHVLGLAVSDLDLVACSLVNITVAFVPFSSWYDIQLLLRKDFLTTYVNARNQLQQ